MRDFAAVALVAAAMCVAVTAQKQQAQNDLDLPIYRSAVPKPEMPGIRSDRATVSLRDSSVQEVFAEKYLTGARIDAVLDFYRAELKRFGRVTECTDGMNEQVSVQLDKSSVHNLGSCRADEFGAGETELKAGSENEFYVVTARPLASQTEFTVVRVRKARARRPADL